MPDYQDNCRSDYSKFDSMTNEELEEILREDATRTDGETSDLDMLLYIMGVLAERRKNSANPGKTPEEAFELFMAHYTPTDSEKEDSLDHAEEKNNRNKHTKVIPMTRWMRRMIAAAAVVVVFLAGTITSSAYGYNLWNIIVQWTAETFYCVTGQGTLPVAPEKENHLEYYSLQDALDKHKIAVPLVPQWFPEGYELIQVEVDTSPVLEKYLAVYGNEDQAIMVQIKRYVDSAPQQIERSSILIEEYESGGNVFYIFENNNQLCAVWVIEEFECYISGELTLTEIRSVIDSIKE